MDSGSGRSFRNRPFQETVAQTAARPERDQQDQSADREPGSGLEAKEKPWKKGDSDEFVARLVDIHAKSSVLMWIERTCPRLYHEILEKKDRPFRGGLSFSHLLVVDVRHERHEAGTLGGPSEVALRLG